MRNALGGETSPYLLQHKDNPVHWQPWSQEALAAAKRDDKPILISIGYAACHWCHVMAHESFESPDIARLMNARFVNIKIDREERPDLDIIYQSALSLLGEQGGWPLTMFLTPDAEPFWGGTYFPPENRWGRPGFPQVLERMAAIYHQEKDKIAKNTGALVDALRKMSQLPEPAGAAALNPDLLNGMATRLAQGIDRTYGGLGGAPKFPQTTALEFIWRAYLRTGDAHLHDAVTLSLDHMCQGGIYDHVGGGFARYSTDEQWLVPHFEKMLYDNALLIDLLTAAWQHTRSPLYAARVHETVDWCLREMIADGGAFAASLDADSEGEEGKFYVWREQHIDALLGSDSARFKSIYDVTPAGNWEGKTILNRSANLALGDAASEASLDGMRKVLLAARAQRTRPGWDDKVLADWNGLMIAALTNASLAFGESAWRAAAERAYAFVSTQMSAPDDRLWHAARAGKTRNAGLLDDYANMARAALTLYEASGSDSYLADARRWSATLDRQFWDDGGGAYFQTPADGETLIARPRTAADNATPAGNGTMVGVLARLSLLSGDTTYRQRADALVNAFAPEIGRNFFPLTTFLNGFDVLTGPVQVVVIGARPESETAALLEAIFTHPLPNRIVSVVTPGDALPRSHPAAGKGRADGRATAYVCVGNTCSLPVTEPAALAAALPSP